MPGNIDSQISRVQIFGFPRAQSLKMETVAEGVETEEAREFLTSLGCNFMQGWLFSPALPQEELTKKYLIPATKF